MYGQASWPVKQLVANGFGCGAPINYAKHRLCRSCPGTALLAALQAGDQSLDCSQTPNRAGRSVKPRRHLLIRPALPRTRPMGEHLPGQEKSNSVTLQAAWQPQDRLAACCPLLGKLACPASALGDAVVAGPSTKDAVHWDRQGSLCRLWS